MVFTDKNLILVIDDEPDIYSIIKRMFKNNKDYDFISEVNVENTLKTLGKHNKKNINLLIIDYDLTNGTAFDIINHIKQYNLNIPVIIISGQKVDKLLSLESGAINYISKPFETKELFFTVKNLLNLFQAYKGLEQANSIIYALSKALDKRDTYTENHSSRVAEFSTMLYYELGSDNKKEIRILQTGSLLHDIGKIGVQDSILKSSNSLTKEERIIIEQHPVIGYEICKGIGNLKDMLPIIRSHHEKLDGSGYPDGLKGKEIHPLVQIVSIADIFDALTSKRKYRNENGIRKALDIMEQEAKAGKLNKEYMYIFKKMIYEKTGGIFEED